MNDQFQKLKQKLNLQGELAFEVVSGSMEPVIRTHSTITVAPLLETPKRFDILVFAVGDILICHYFWFLNPSISTQNEKLFITRSMSGFEDTPFSPSDVLGKVISHRLSSLQKFRIILGALWGRRI